MVEQQRKYTIVQVIGLLVLAVCAWASAQPQAHAGGSSSTGGILPYVAAKWTATAGGLGLRTSVRTAGVPHRVQP